ncbi:MAG TPA: alpha/beta hydrolase [Longimicrobiales bacterium]
MRHGGTHRAVLTGMSPEVVVHRSVPNGEVLLHVASSGTGPPVVLLHGFPANRTSWRHQRGPLADAGFTALAPDLRGYNMSRAPARVEAYAPDHLVSDVAAIVRSTGHNRAHIVGHDWGGVIAWWFAAAHPELLDRLVILNAPHPTIFRRRVRRPPQLLRSWYAGLFQLPLLPEIALRALDFAALRWIFRATAPAGTFSRAEIEGYVAGLGSPRALSAAVNYYRAAVRYARRAPRRVHTDAPTLVIWGERDRALSVELLDGIERYAPNVRIERFRDAGHWVHNEAPDEVTRLLIRFLTQS